MTIVTRAGKGSTLTWAELDGNFTDLDARTAQAWAMEGLEPTLRDGVGNPAELAVFRGNTVTVMFGPSTMTEVFVNWDVPFNWAEGTDLYAAIHWSPGASTSTGNVRWGLEFTYAAINGTFGATNSVHVDSNIATASSWKHIQAVSSAFSGSQADHNTRFLIRIYRDAAHVDDTFPGDAYMIGVDFYYQVNKFGQSSITPPYA